MYLNIKMKYGAESVNSISSQHI